MNPFDQVTMEITDEQTGTSCTWGGTILAVYTDDNNEEMAIVSLLNSTGVVHVKQSDLTAL